MSSLTLMWNVTTTDHLIVCQVGIMRMNAYLDGDSLASSRNSFVSSGAALKLCFRYNITLLISDELALVKCLNQLFLNCRKTRISIGYT